MPNKKPEWNSHAKTARLLGVKDRQLISKHCKGRLKPAVGIDGKEKGKINFWHSSVQEYKAELEAKKAAVSGPVPKSKPETGSSKVQTATTTNNGNFNIEVTFEEIENLTLKQIVQQYGGITGFKNYVDALDKMSAWKNKELKYEQARKKLIKKNPVARSLFSIVDIAFRRIVTEYPTTVTDQLIAIALGKKKTARIDAIALQEQALSKILKGVKKEVLKGLDDVEKD